MTHRNPIGGGVLALALIAPAVHSESPPLEIRWSIDGGSVNTVLPEGTDLGGGSFAYDGQATDPATGLVLDYGFTGNSLWGLEGNVNLVNALNDPISVAVDVVFPFAMVPGESELEGFGVVGLTTGVGGGAIASIPPWLWQTLIDDQPAGPQASLFFHPFEMTISGPGSAAAFSDFGTAEPVFGPPITRSVGFRIQFTLTEIDAASVTSAMVVTSCPADLSGDGAVGSGDLAIVVGEWGRCPPAACPADLNGDGEVGTQDILLLLAAWGPCSVR